MDADIENGTFYTLTVVIEEKRYGRVTRAERARLRALDPSPLVVTVYDGDRVLVRVGTSEERASEKYRILSERTRSPFWAELWRKNAATK